MEMRNALLHYLIALAVATVNVEAECLRLMTSPPSYSGKICPSDFFYTFVCDASGQYIRWTFNNEIEKTYYGDANIFYLQVEREDRNYTPYYDYHFALPLSLNLIDGNFSMRSTLTIQPHNLTEFPVECSTHCGQMMTTESIVYTVAEIPKPPREIIYEKRSDNCTGESKAKVKWEHPENMDRITFSHYEYIYDGTKPVKRFMNTSFFLDRNPSRAYDFEVYAVDKCGQKGDRALVTIPAN